MKKFIDFLDEIEREVTPKETVFIRSENDGKKQTKPQ